ncbi:hypothetical protein P8629_06965 [Hydrogenovibrio sp. 3SP14C1]|uniref:hypothetical protein n=1 Tax=Hydrogenovibrio sp. 3SP14C1 TaxID=3038774 RepID=UPI002416BF6C|nr:hypothetical protein [Hydrogenovibrio sp. 3SP14C1]MDG4812746.1 hypothetical protein [Hydrogenovibrio sp. 3SP14C1]
MGPIPLKQKEYKCCGFDIVVRHYPPAGSKPTYIIRKDKGSSIFVNDIFLFKGGLWVYINGVKLRLIERKKINDSDKKKLISIFKEVEAI